MAGTIGFPILLAYCMTLQRHNSKMEVHNIFNVYSFLNRDLSEYVDSVKKWSANSLSIFQNKSLH